MFCLAVFAAFSAELRGSGHTLHSNRISQTKDPGIRMDGVTGSHLLQNRIQSTQEAGIYMSGCSDCTLTGNQITRAGDNGISLFSGITAPGNTLVRNTCRRNLKADLVDFNGPYANVFLENRLRTSVSLP